MSDTRESQSDEAQRRANENADVRAALAILVIAVLTAINFVYTGGLPAFFAHIF